MSLISTHLAVELHVMYLLTGTSLDIFIKIYKLDSQEISYTAHTL